MSDSNIQKESTLHIASVLQGGMDQQPIRGTCYMCGRENMLVTLRKTKKQEVLACTSYDQKRNCCWSEAEQAEWEAAKARRVLATASSGSSVVVASHSAGSGDIERRFAALEARVAGSGDIEQRFAALEARVAALEAQRVRLRSRTPPRIVPPRR